MALQALLCAAALAALTLQAEGACVHQGSLFANNTVWKPDSCQECSCHSNIVVCETTSCGDPQCDFQKGEVLRVAVNGCCPECATRTQGFCQHEGKLHGHNTEWTSSACTLCYCANGKVHCVPKSCPNISCRRGEREHVAGGDCCPKCVGTGESCHLDGHLLYDGEEWQHSRCSKCVCRNGVIQCFTAECPPLSCEKDENLALVPGKCCPECLPESCSVSGKVYEHGEQWKENSCTTCMCDKGQVRCHAQPCAPITCEKGQKKVKRSGQCCEECASSKGNCLYEGSVRYHGDLWNGSHCEFCMCDRGQVLCQEVECARVECAWGEELIHLEGKCCPECISTGSYCVYKENTEEMPHSDLSGIKHLTSGEKWTEGLCKECECQDSQVTCYTRSCPPCPVGMLALDVRGECCPECRPVQCHPECLTCSQTYDHCDICNDEGKVLQMGSCVQSCDSGFYQDGRSCLACKKMCSTCENAFECTACSGSLLMKSGHCVVACGDGYFQDHRSCAACHYSCSTCRGSYERDCLNCKDQSHVMKAGVCVATCGQGFFIQNGICTACDQSCQTCYSDSPTCSTCFKGQVLHGGKCIPECPDEFHADATGRCTACHDTCASCVGPLANQCSSCSTPLALHQGQCLSTCGEGLYPDGSICKACHQSCRACLGPGNSHCTMCAEPGEVLQAEQEYYGEPYGICQSQCKAQFYRENTGMCRGD